MTLSAPEYFENTNFLKLRMNWVKYIPELFDCTTNTLVVFSKLRDWWLNTVHNCGTGAHFYKFLEPCDHQKYTFGDSLLEELPTLTKKQFATAFDKIGVRYKSQKRFKTSENPFVGIDGEEKFFASYRTMDNLTWYACNEDLMNRRMREALEKFEADFFRHSQKEKSEVPRSNLQSSTVEDRRSNIKEHPKCHEVTSSISTNTTTNTSTNTPTHTEREQFSEIKKESRNGTSDRAKYQNRTGASGNENSKSQTSSTFCLDNNESDQTNYSEISLEKEKPKTDPYFGQPTAIEYQRQKAKDSAIAQSPFGSVEEADHFYAALKKYVKVTARKELTEGSITGIAKSTYNRLLSNQADPEDRELLQRWQSGELSAFLDERVTRQSYQVAKTTHDLMSINPPKEVKI